MKPQVKVTESHEISSGTLRTQDLLYSFAAKLEHLTHVWMRDMEEGTSDADEIGESFMLCGTAHMIGSMIEHGNDSPEVDERANEILDLLDDRLNDFAGEGLYFGANTSDGASFGFWVQEEQFDPAADEIPAFLRLQAE